MLATITPGEQGGVVRRVRTQRPGRFASELLGPQASAIRAKLNSARAIGPVRVQDFEDELQSLEAKELRLAKVDSSCRPPDFDTVEKLVRTEEESKLIQSNIELFEVYQN